MDRAEGFHGLAHETRVLILSQVLASMAGGEDLEDDALDRWRIGDLDPSFLRPRGARDLLVANRKLWESTRGPLETQHAFEEIIAAALGLGLVVA